MIYFYIRYLDFHSAEREWCIYLAATENLQIKEDGDQFNLGEIVLNEEAFALNDVNVSAARKLPFKREIDRTVINLEDEPNTQGSSVLDILERTPGIILDRQNNSISMLGKDGVNVMINGKMTYSNGERHHSLYTLY